MKKLIAELLMHYTTQTTAHSVHISWMDRYEKRQQDFVVSIVKKIRKHKIHQHVYVKQSDLL